MSSALIFTCRLNAALIGGIVQVDAVTNEAIKYRDAYRMSKNFALALADRGAKKGDVMALFLPNCVEFPLLFSGAPAIGVTVTTLNPVYTETEIAKQLLMSKASWFSTTNELLPVLKGAIEKVFGTNAKKYHERIFIVGGLLLQNTACSIAGF